MHDVSVHTKCKIHIFDVITTSFIWCVLYANDVNVVSEVTHNVSSRDTKSNSTFLSILTVFKESRMNRLNVIRSRRNLKRYYTVIYNYGNPYEKWNISVARPLFVATTWHG